MYGSKILTSGEIKNLKAKKYYKLDIVIYNDMAYFCKSSICRLSRKPDNLKAQINRYVRTTNDSSITIKRADAYHAVNTEVMAIFADYSIKASQLSFVNANVALDALEVSTDDKRLKLIDLITESANNLDSLESNIDPRIAKLERSEAKHEIAERQSAATIAELRQKLDKVHTKLTESKREYDELVVENVQLHNRLDNLPFVMRKETHVDDTIAKRFAKVRDDYQRTNEDYKKAWNDSRSGGLPYIKQPWHHEQPKLTFIERVKALFK